VRYKRLTLTVFITLAALLLLVLFKPHVMIAPGKLIDAHAELATDCFACHTPFLGSSPAKCVSCHEVDEIGIKTTKGLAIDTEKKNVAFHQKLTEADCVACHSDHRGVQAFRPIGRFSHALLEASVNAQCDGCHKKPGDALHRKLKGNCGQCHVQDRWIPATFDHDEYFRFDKHHTTECETCHVESDYAGYTCYGCHEHSRSKIREEHLEEGIRDYENCVECHRSGDEEEAERAWRRKRKEQGASKDGTRPGYPRRGGGEHEEPDED
jgi:hypothetical protein